MRDARGFTLVEVMVALGLLVLVASFTLPVALTSSDRARALTAERIMLLAPNLARGEARALGQPVALVLLPLEVDPGTEPAGVRLVLVRRPDPESDSPLDQRADPEDVLTWPVVGQGQMLPEGTALWNGAVDDLEISEPEAEDESGLPEEAFARLSAEADGGVGPTSGPDGPADAVVLAWYLSDGSAVVGQAAMLRLADGRVVRAQVEPLTGQLVLSVPRDEDEAATGPDEPDAGEGPVGQDRAGDPDPGEDPDGRRRFENLGFEELGFEEIGFEDRGFEDLGERFGRGPGHEEEEAERAGTDASPGTEPAEPGSPETGIRTTPHPPQPR